MNITILLPQNLSKHPTLFQVAGAWRYFRKKSLHQERIVTISQKGIRNRYLFLN